MDIQFSDRLQQLPPYLFVKIDNAKRKHEKKGKIFQGHVLFGEVIHD